MQFFQELLAGFILAHALWALFYCVGALLIALAGSRPAGDRRYFVEVLIYTALGAAAFMFSIFILGIVGLLNMVALSLLAVGFPALLLAMNLMRSTARSVFHELIAPWRSFDRLAGTIYVVLVFFFAPSLLAPVEFDSGMYHLAHAVDWARAGHLYVDAYVRYPLFAYNVELLYASLFAIRLGFYVQVVDWLMFLWSALGIYAFTSFLLEERLLPRSADEPKTISGRFGAARLVALVAAFVYCASPIVLRYADTAYVDIAIGFFFLSMVASAALALEHDRRLAIVSGVIGGSLVGMKLPLFAFIPLVLLLLLYLAAVTAAARRTTALWFAVFGVVACPWYLRNFIIAGDPISPVLNIALKRSDPFWSRVDYVHVMNALQGAHEPVLLAPIFQFLKPGMFEEEGGSLNLCFLLIPVAVCLVLLFSRRLRSRDRPFFVACASTAFAVCAIYLVSNNIGRYVIEFYAAYISVLSVMIVWLVIFAVEAFSPRIKRRAVLLGSVCALAATALPSPAGPEAFRGMIARYSDIGSNVTHPARYYSSVTGFRDAASVSDIVNASGKHGAVLAIALENLAYAFREHGIVSIGDWFGPGRYSDLQEMIETAAVPEYLRKFDIAAVIIGPRSVGFTSAEGISFVRQLGAAGYVELTTPDSTVRDFVRPDVIQQARARGYRNELMAGSSDGVSVSFLDAFRRGRINTARPASTPTRRGSLILPWPSEDGFYSTITVVSGYTYGFSNVRLGSRPVLILDVSKPISAGRNAWAWVEVTPVGGRTTRVVSAICPPADGTHPAWQHVAVTLPVRNVKATIIFGASSFPGGGIGDWIAFAHPILEDAVLP